MATVKLQHKFKAPIEKVWNAITQPEEMKTWYFHVKDFALLEGNVFTFYEQPEGGTFLHRCEILKVNAPNVFEHTWEHPTHSKGKSVLRWELTPIDEQTTQLDLTHSGLENFADGGPDFAPENYEFGWQGIIKIALRNYLNGIERLTYDIDIYAQPQKVWEQLWGEESYKQWTAAFIEGSYYDGTIANGERVYLLSPSGEGMYSDIVYMKENEALIFSHIGTISNNEEQPVDESWTGSIESYTLIPIPEGTKVRVAVDTLHEYKAMMNEKFPKALQILKTISEQ
jgi:uncharacterized protein YndB with AHSA1/START domain